MREEPTPEAAGGPDPRDAELLDMLREDGSHWAAVPPVPGVHGLVEIAAGGQGRVYHGRRLGDERPVAVKVLHATGGPDDVARRRFEREVELLAELDHPGIVPVLGHGFAAGRPYLVMDFVAGRPLHQVSADPGVDRHRRVEMLRQLAAAVAHAHARGVLHRDLSPSNVLVDEADRVTVLDFGLARAVDHSVARSAISVSGDFVGSVAWAAPEQFDGDPSRADVRTDVHAIGAIGYLLLTRRPPHEPGRGLPAIVRAITEGPAPSPRSAAPDLPADLVAILDRCLARDPDDRYAAAADVRDDLRRVQVGEPIAARQSGAWRRAQRSLARSRWIIAGVAAAAILLGVAAVGAIVLADRATEAEREAAAALAESRRQGSRMQRTLEVLTGALGTVDPGSGTPGEGPATAEHVLEAVEMRVSGTGLPADVRAELLTELARIRMNRGEYALAEPLASAACALVPPDDSLAIAEARRLRGLALHGLDRLDEALEDLQEAAGLFDPGPAGDANADSMVAGRRGRIGRRDAMVAWQRRFDAESTRVHAAATMGSMGDLEAMQATLEGVIERTDGDPPNMTSVAATAHRRLAELWSYRGATGPALEHAERSRVLLEAAGNGVSLRAANLSRLLAEIALTDGRWADARDAAVRAGAIHGQLMQAPHPMRVIAMAIEAQALARLGDVPAADDRLARAETLRTQVVQDHSRLSAELLERRADALHALGRDAEALEAWRLARERDARIPAEPRWGAEPAPASLDQASRVGPPPA